MEKNNQKTLNNNISLSPISIDGAKIILNQMERCICKINGDNNNKTTGFFIRIPYKFIFLYGLITNRSQGKIIKNDFIELTLDDDKIHKKIGLKNRKIFNIIKFDIIFIEIYPLEDKISNYLELDDNINIEKNKSIYTIYYPKNKNLMVSYGLLLDITNNFILHNCNVEENTLGAPILSLDDFKIIGINNGNSRFNIKFFINEFFQQYIENIKQTKNELNELNIRYLINNEEKVIRLFDELFVNNNNKNCKLVLYGKEIELTSNLDITKMKIDKNILEIKLKETKKITNMSYMFYNCKLLLSLEDFDKWDTSIVTDISYMFQNCLNLESLPDISNWNTSNITNMSCLFYNCSKLKHLPDISKWNIKNVKFMFNIFSGCSSLLSLPDISKWDTSNVTEMASIFRECSSLTYLPDISKWKTNNVVNMAEMFNGCKLLSSLPDISKWNTNKVINLIGTFANCSSLVFLPDISKWNTENVWNMNGLFYNCTSLSYLPNISNWNTNKALKKVGIFDKCINLNNIQNK